MKKYNDPRAQSIASIAGLITKGAAPSSDLIEACRDLNAAMARWAARTGYTPTADTSHDEELA